MCGRYYLTTPPAQLMERFGLEKSELPVEPRQNICPTESVPIVMNMLAGTLVEAKWGLIPFWAKDPRIGNKMFNARSEGIADKPAYRAVIRKKRCLVLADGFYEWRKNENGTKTPMRFALASGQPFAFAGLWDLWRPPAMEPTRTCTIITTAANPVVARVHDRMPVILYPEDEAVWLDQNEDSFAEAISLLRPYSADAMTLTEAPAELFARPRAGPPH